MKKSQMKKEIKDQDLQLFKNKKMYFKNYKNNSKIR